MTELKIDNATLAKLVLEITERYKKIMKLFPKDNESILKHLAASSIHMAFFMRDIHDITQGVKTNIEKGLEERFVNECGCDFKDKK